MKKNPGVMIIFAQIANRYAWGVQGALELAQGTKVKPFVGPWQIIPYRQNHRAPSRTANIPSGDTKRLPSRGLFLKSELEANVARDYHRSEENTFNRERASEVCRRTNIRRETL